MQHDSLSGMQKTVPIADHGVIGNLGSCALVTRDGTIDWCCLPHLDSPSVFGSLLDSEQGGSFTIRPHGHFTVKQEYLPQTNVLQTTFVTPKGTVCLLDWMHMGGFAPQEDERHMYPAVYRLVQCVEGAVPMHIEFSPRLDYARGETLLEKDKGGKIVVTNGNHRLLLQTHCDLKIQGDTASATVVLRAGSEVSFCCRDGYETDDAPPIKRSLERTITCWREWLADKNPHGCHISTPWRAMVERSALTLRVLSGGKGIAAAVTTSLPEVIGGSDNWDYRYNWIRDTSFTVQALGALGYLQDAREFLDWLVDLLKEEGRHPDDLLILYPLRDDGDVTEHELSHLAGYANSKPVRIGNGAASQRQFDIYGDILRTVFISEELHPGVDHLLCTVLTGIVDYVCSTWREPDHGIWEVRQEPQHHTYSKVMCWVAIDRGIRLAEEHGWPADVERWKRERDELHETILKKAWDPKRGALMQSFGSDILDATSLLFSILGFLPPDHPYMESTLDAVVRDLTVGPLVYRSDAHKGKEGTFGLCGFWLVEALLHSGRHSEALENFTALLNHANHLGLYAEEIDPESGAFLGNFPQAFTHVGLINTAIALSRAHLAAEQTPTQPGL